MKPKDRILQWARPEIVALKPYQSAREEFISDGREMILLDANENPFNNGMNRYPDPMQKKLKQRLAEAKGVSVEQIYLGTVVTKCLTIDDRLLCSWKRPSHYFTTNFWDVPSLRRYQ